MERIKLTNQRIEKATVGGYESRAGKSVNQVFLWDTEAPGLAARITKGGAKSFIFQGKLKSAAIRKTIGSCASWTLSDARTEARRLKTLIDQGIDPRELEREREAEKLRKKEAVEAAEKEAEANKKFTLRALCDTYADYLESRGKDKTAKGVRSVVKVHLAEADPDLAKKPAREVTAHDVAGLIRGITEKGKGRTAGIFRSTLAAAYACARRAPFDGTMPKSFIDFNIDSNPVDPIPPIPVKARHRTLSQKELKAYIEALGDDLVDNALKLALFSGGQRMAQILRAEVSDWNAETKTLRLVDPKGKRTEPREHLLPLAPVAAALVTDLVAKSEKAGTTLLFPSMTKKTPIHASITGPRVTEIAKKIGGEPFDLRDIRRTCETMLAGLGISRDIRAQLLSHGISGVQAAHYDRHEYTKEKRATLVKWERYLKRITSGEEDAKIVSFEGAVKAR
ncbi:MAG: hypothetical protein AVO39_11430 [delta proteobacterium MLS_D]|jgi:integrase|nr:MAG: hypothetical protein AVO39_11430 [delta proteobacterium MLS_D]